MKISRLSQGLAMRVGCGREAGSVGVWVAVASSEVVAAIVEIEVGEEIASTGVMDGGTVASTGGLSDLQAEMNNSEKKKKSK
jgi:hypothetical protein